MVEQVQAGSARAFEEIYDRHHRGILAFCRHMLGSRHEAEDVVQHTFIAAYQSLLADDCPIALKAWLYVVARNRCLSLLRARREHADIDDAATVVPATAGLCAEVEGREDLRAMLADLQRLPEDQRAALVLAELTVHSHEQIAVILGVPTAKVKALVFQARAALMSRRQARDADCGPIREQLGVLGAGALRRGELRDHVAQCEGCRVFVSEVRRQRAAMAVLLGVAPSLALKHSTLTAASAAVGHGAGGGTAAVGGGTAAAGGTAAVGGGTAAGVGSSAVLTGGGALLGAKVVLVKAAIALSLTGAVAGGGYATVQQLSSAPSPTSPAQTTPAQADQLQKPGAKPPPVGGLVMPAIDDKCPNKPGLGSAGCPSNAPGDRAPADNNAPSSDRDGDAIPNRKDRCPTQPGATCG